jgi:glycosyltransferase involved in cell wall biosynthesis
LRRTSRLGYAEGASPRAEGPGPLVRNVSREATGEAQFRRIKAAEPWVERPDILIHAIAQLPDNVALDLPVALPDRPRVELLARAYGIADRVTFGSLEEPTTVLRVPLTMAELVQKSSDPRDPPASCRKADEIFAGHRIAHVANLPAPYRIPLFSRMFQRLKNAGAEYRLFFLGTHSRNRPWIGADSEAGFQYEALTSFEVPLGIRHPLLPVNLERRLSAFRPTVVVAGTLSPFVAGRTARLARKYGAVFGIWSGEIAGRSTAASRLRRVQRERLAHKCDFAIAYGSLAGEYLRGLRPDLPLVYGRNTSDAYAVARERPVKPRTVQLLAIADMALPGKGIEVLIDALSVRPGLRCCLTVVGPGARDSGLEKRAQEDGRIRFLGALPQAEVRERYSESDVFLFPSTIDVFGLALVEAMGSGLAPVISSGTGAVADLAVDGWNCVLVKDHAPEAWADALQKVVLDHDLRLSFGENAARTIRNRWTMNHACDAAIAGLRLGLLVRERETP